MTDLRHLTPAEQDAAIKAWINFEKENGIAVTQAPLIRLRTMFLSDREMFLGVSFHHAILDGWSDVAMLVEILSDYVALLRGETLPLRPAPPSYAEFVRLELAAASERRSKEYSAAKTDWR